MQIVGKQKLESVILQNDSLIAEIIPEDGGRLRRLYSRKHDAELIWSNPRTEKVGRYYACNYDDLSASGIEEAFPTVQPCTVDGISLPFFGEIWTIGWTGESTDDSVSLECFSPIWPARIRKAIMLTEDCLSYEYVIRNIGYSDLPYIFGFHPSFSVYEDTEIILPSGTCTMLIDPCTCNSCSEDFEWPLFGTVDISRAYPSGKGNYCNFIRYPVLEGRYAIQHSSKGIRTDVIFDSSVFPLLSIWPLYGGCRGLECIMTEAFTSWPAVLSEAIADGTASVLSHGEEFRTSVRYVVSDL